MLGLKTEEITWFSSKYFSELQFSRDEEPMALCDRKAIGSPPLAQTMQEDAFLTRDDFYEFFTHNTHRVKI